MIRPAMQSDPFKNVFSRIYYAFAAATVFSAVVFVPVVLFVAFMQLKISIRPEIAKVVFFSVFAILFSVCYIAAPKLHACIPLRRSRTP